MMSWVPTTSVQKSNTCPSGYSLKDNKCIKTEVLLTNVSRFLFIML